MFSAKHIGAKHIVLKYYLQNCNLLFNVYQTQFTDNNIDKSSCIIS
jgi:hypothetical protein